MVTRILWIRDKTFANNTGRLDDKQHNEVPGIKKRWTGQVVCEPAIEAISLDMKQQELDGRYVFDIKDVVAVNRIVGSVKFVFSSPVASR